MTEQNGPSVYDYSPHQAAMNRLYELHVAALTSRRYHGAKLRAVSRWIAIVDAVTAIASSAAIATFALSGAKAGPVLYAVLTSLAAIAAVGRTAFKLSERADRHARMSTAWSEVFLDMDRLIGLIRLENRLSEARLAQIDDLVVRFQRVEMMDDPEPDRALHERCHREALEALPSERRWLPQS